MKPNTKLAMSNLIIQVRAKLPFDSPQSTLCQADCRGCSKKLLEFLDMTLDDWEIRLNQGDEPSLGEVDKLAKCCNKIYNAIKKNNLLADDLDDQ